MKLKNRVALVTGANSGIGRAIAIAFAEQGAKVAVNGRNMERINGVVTEIEKLGGEAMGAPTDVAESSQVKDMFSKVLDRFGTIDILVNNAGHGGREEEVKKRQDQRIEELSTTGVAKTAIDPIRGMADEYWARTIAVHLSGTFYCTREALNVMMDKGYGKIINVVSVAGISGHPAAPDYAAAKGGVISFTKSVAVDVIVRGVYVNAIAPGMVETPLLGIWTERQVAMGIAQTPLGRMGAPEEISSTAVFLASDDSSFIVGQVISPNGGSAV